MHGMKWSITMYCRHIRDIQNQDSADSGKISDIDHVHEKWNRQTCRLDFDIPNQSYYSERGGWQDWKQLSRPDRQLLWQSRHTTTWDQPTFRWELLHNVMVSVHQGVVQSSAILGWRATKLIQRTQKLLGAPGRMRRDTCRHFGWHSWQRVEVLLWELWTTKGTRIHQNRIHFFSKQRNKCLVQRSISTT